MWNDKDKPGLQTARFESLEFLRSDLSEYGKRGKESVELERKAVLLSKSHPRYGYRRITALMRRDDHVVNEVRVQALRRKHCLQVRKKQCKTKRLRPEQAQRLEACHAGHVWCWDFVYDQTECGSSFRLLSVLDEYTRECYSLRPRP